VFPVNNSDVPYSVAYGEENVYFMLNNKFIKINDLEFYTTVANAKNLYGDFYGHIKSKKGKYRKYNFKNLKLVRDRFDNYYV
jgi:hypothetical protein